MTRFSLLFIAAIGVAWQVFLSSSVRAQPPVRLELVGLDVVPHQFSRELRWRRLPEPELGALVRLYIRNPEAGNGEAQGTVKPIATFNGKRPGDLLRSGDWAWHDTPDNREGGETERKLEPGKLAVWTFNTNRRVCGPGEKVKIEIQETKSERKEASIQTITVSLDTPSILLSRLFFHDTNGDGLVDSCTAHIQNSSRDPVKVKSLRVWSPGQDGTSIHNLTAGAWISEFKRTPSDGSITPGERGVLEASLGELPNARGVIEISVEGPKNVRHSCWGHLRFKDDRFAIGSGWLDIPSKPGIKPITREPYLKLIKRMHIDTTHVGELAGYTDQMAPDGLYTRYPLKLLSGFEDVARYSKPEWARRIHGVDILGEPQMGKSPSQSFDVLRRYDRATYPTTVTLSEEKGFRYFAGLSDYPHFDAYRVNAPAADSWGKYDRWDGKVLRWGAPLEGIGEMTRTLRILSRPAPIAAWSQNVHEGWDGYWSRKRRSPTVDEIRIQAYEALANGITGLYWYSLQSWSMLKYRDTITETTRIGRHIRLLENWYSRADVYQHERKSKGNLPDWDLNSLITSDTAILFAIDLSYFPDPVEKVFRFHGKRSLDHEYPLPRFLQNPAEVFRIDAEGVHPVKHSATTKGIRITDVVDGVGVYIASRRSGMESILSRNHNDLIAEENRHGKDPGQDDQAFKQLLTDLGFSEPPK